jgi:hypothetical protein
MLETAPILTEQVIDDLEKIHSEMNLWRFRSLQAEENNKYGIELQTFGDVSAVRANSSAPAAFNRVIGLTSTTRDHLDAILDWYGATSCQIEIVPPLTKPDLHLALHKRGFYAGNLLSTLYCEPVKGPTSSDIEIRQLDRSEIPEFARVYFEAAEFHATNRDERERMITLEHLGPQWACYLALVSGQPAAVGSVFANGSLAYLGMAATIPQFRNRGIQQALIQTRLNQIAGQCDLALSEAAPESVSQRNLQRTGFHLAYTRMIWLKA